MPAEGRGLCLLWRGGEKGQCWLPLPSSHRWLPWRLPTQTTFPGSGLLKHMAKRKGERLGLGSCSARAPRFPSRGGGRGIQSFLSGRTGWAPSCHPRSSTRHPFAKALLGIWPKGVSTQHGKVARCRERQGAAPCCELAWVFPACQPEREHGRIQERLGAKGKSRGRRNLLPPPISFSLLPGDSSHTPAPISSSLTGTFLPGNHSLGKCSQLEFQDVCPS